MLRFLADNTNYRDFIRGLDRLTSDQKAVLFERLKLELDVPKKSVKTINNEKIESVNKESVTVRTRAMSNKPKSVIECCMHCGSIKIKKHGTTKGGVQRYICKDCGKSFSENYGLITHYTHLSEWQWKEVIRGIIYGLSLTDIAKNIKTSVSTTWLCRTKIYQMIKGIHK